ncbi:TonB-linked outer membrane protein, SusC/RagA family [Hymenobacter daecheongensis DSM 21074]|uniref:TonB-linked outer membrane protein, SusC/RagA family n=1 Tax=Hymenobacter daecheongensis DSM 21074 TaxID=1121955 RepID=A0A1M6GRX0_9BACT|nr:SusC/RagA family TonB-linked outer membrane protein [Hymenobacter daecheongensis]SHJ12662.1 TonB-linked outer membrane protein, SusC/RagA family [Hymenobacter daecheongensis DSM 21074]
MKKIVLMSFLLMLTLLQQVTAQNRNISGRVTDRQSGDGLPGVTVLLKGTTNGVSTNSDGSFTLSAPAEGGTLVFSSVGYLPSERQIGNETQINIGLSTDSKQLSEVVVTAFGREQEKKALGFSVSEVKSQELTQARSTNVVNSLTAKVAGVRVQGSSGMVGASSNIFIRGMTTFTGSNQPLFVVDGIPIDNGGGTNALQQGVANSNRAIDLNQDDIESVSILKGPAAAVLYGSRAASGAVVITTKKGATLGTKKQSITFSSNYNIVKVGRTPDYQNEFAQGNSGVFGPITQMSWGPRVTGQTVKNFRGEDEVLSINPDNVTSIFKTGSNFQNNVSLSGATERTRYYASYGNLHEVGILDNNDLKRNTVTFNGNAQLTNKLRTGTNVIFSNSVSKRTIQGNSLANPFFHSWVLPRSFDVFKYPFEQPSGGQQNAQVVGTFTTNNTFFGASDNPLWSIKNNTYDDETNRIVGNVSIGYDFTDWLSLDYKLGTDTYSQQFKYVNARDSRGITVTYGGGGSFVGNIQDETYNRREISSYLTLNIRRDISENFNARLLLGNEINQRRTDGLVVVGSDIQVRGFNNISNTKNYTPFAEKTSRRLIGVYGDLQLGFKNFAFLNLSGRNDYSSTFSKNKRSYFYPGASASIVLSDAIPMLKENSVLDQFKIRAAAAQVGREAPVYGTNTTYQTTSVTDGFGPAINYPFLNQVGLTYNNVGGNIDLGPEFTTSYEAGADLNFFKGRLGIEATYYVQKSKDIIFAVPFSATSGFTSVNRNIGTAEARGIELMISSTPIKAGSFTYSNSFNYSRVRNKVLELAPGVTFIQLGGFTTPGTRLIAGQPYGVLFGSKFLRQNGDSGPLLLNAQGRTQQQPDNGVIGDPNPDWTGGITNNFAYKGLTLSTLLDVRVGGDIVSRNVFDLRRNGAAKETGDRTRTYIIDGVIKQADGTFAPNNVQVTAENYFTDLWGSGPYEFAVFDGSWLRLREVALNYSLPKTLTDKTFFGAVELGLNARNLFLYAPNIPHIDPEVNTTGVSNSQGFEFNSLPQSKMYGGSIRLTF